MRVVLGRPPLVRNLGLRFVGAMRVTRRALAAGPEQ